MKAHMARGVHKVLDTEANSRSPSFFLSRRKTVTPLFTRKTNRTFFVNALSQLSKWKELCASEFIPITSLLSARQLLSRIFCMTLAVFPLALQIWCQPSTARHGSVPPKMWAESQQLALRPLTNRKGSWRVAEVAYKRKEKKYNSCTTGCTFPGNVLLQHAVHSEVLVEFRWT